MKTQFFRIGDTVTVWYKKGDPKPDGTVVDIIGDKVRVYWRYPKGKVTDYYPSDLDLVSR